MKKWFYNGNEIKMVTYYIYLGLFFTFKTILVVCCKEFMYTITEIIHMLKRLIGRCQCLPINIIFEIFNKTILPVLSHASEIWGYKKYDDI